MLIYVALCQVGFVILGTDFLSFTFYLAKIKKPPKSEAFSLNENFTIT